LMNMYERASHALKLAGFRRLVKNVFLDVM
jgi:hypothetical protein